MSDTGAQTNVNIITQVGRVRLVHLVDSPHRYGVETPTGTEAFTEYLPAYFAYLDAIGWTDK